MSSDILPVGGSSNLSEAEAIDDARTLNYLAIISMVYRRNNGALNYLTLSDSILPDYPPTLRLLAKTFYRLGEFDRVVDLIFDLDQLDAMDSEDEMIELKARALAGLGFVEAARATLLVHAPAAPN